MKKTKNAYTIKIIETISDPGWKYIINKINGETKIQVFIFRFFLLNIIKLKINKKQFIKINGDIDIECFSTIIEKAIKIKTNEFILSFNLKYFPNLKYEM